MYTRVCQPAYLCIHVRVCARACVCVFMYACLCMRARACLSVCACVRSCSRVHARMNAYTCWVLLLMLALLAHPHVSVNTENADVQTERTSY